MYEAIKNTRRQFEFKPKLENADLLDYEAKPRRFMVVGMGGSPLAAGLLKVWRPELDLAIHRNYGLPAMSEESLRERLVILSSYSGNTEEVLDAYDEAGGRGLARAAISIGGKLLERAKKDGVPYVQMPDTGIQPRSALPMSLKGLLKITGEERALAEVNELHETFHPETYEKEGKALAEYLRGHVPVIYSSERNEPIVYNWRIKFNETGKIPAFHNVFPELNHNEMTGFDPVRALTAVSERPTSNGASVLEERKKLNEPFSFIFLKDAADHPKIQKRMEVTEKLYRDRGLTVKIMELEGKTVWHKIFNSLALADWAAYYTAEGYGLEAEEVPMVEEFKRLIA